MAHQVCHDIGNWVEQNVQQQVEKCTEQDCNWWCLCCNKWFCWLVWIIVTITTWVVQTVCEIVEDVIDVVVTVFKGVVDILVGLFTGDWTRLAAGFGELIGAGLVFVINLIHILTLGTLVGAFKDSRDAWRLRNFANGLLTDKYGKEDPKALMQMQDALGINSGGFGLRLKCTAIRTFLRSDFSTQQDGSPDLILWLRQSGVDIKTLAGFNKPSWWSREWPELIGDAGVNISESDLDNYINNAGRGDNVKHFTIFCMSTGNMQNRLDCATQHATEIGLILQWTIIDKQITSADQLIINRNNFPNILLEPPFSRHKQSIDPALASMELCSPLTFGVFAFTETGANGISSLFATADCIDASSGPLTGSGVTGSSFRYRQPDIAFKYVAIHEMGHTFGLCHVDGLLRIMFTNADKSIWSWSSALQYWNNGLEAGFVFEEAQKVWEYIVRNFDKACLETRQF